MNWTTPSRALPRVLLLTAAAVAAFAGPTAQAQAPAYPARAVQLVAQQPPGSASDAMTRIWAECAAREFGQPVVVQNKPGANGILAINHLKGQPADGHTLMTIGMSQMTITPWVHKTPPYDPAKDFDIAAAFGVTPLILVASPASGLQRLDQLEAAARQQADGLNYGSPGKGSPAHLLTAALAQRLNARVTHVPFVGEGAGVTALMGGQVQLMTLVIGTAIPQVKAGKLVPLAVFAAQRSSQLPEVPAITELIDAKELARPAWIAVVAKAGTAPEPLQRVHAATQKCLADPGYRSRLDAMNVVPLAAPGAEVRQWAASDTRVWRPLIERLGLATE